MTSEERQILIWAGQVRGYVDSGDRGRLSTLLEEIDWVEVVDLFSDLTLDERKVVFECLDTEKAASVLHDTDDFTREEILEDLQKEEIVEILDIMPHDDAADVAHNLADDVLPGVITLLEQEDRADSDSLRELLKHPEDTAGGRMTDLFIAVEENKTAADAIEVMRSSEVPHPVQVYVTDADGKLRGLIAINRLATAQRTRVLSELMDTDLVTVKVSDDQEDVANTVTSYDLLAVPVVDSTDVLVGIITVDDVLDVIKEEATEDMYRMAGTDYDEMIDGPAFWAAKVRLPWLLTTLVGGVVCALIIRYFHAALGEMNIAVLAFFVPAIMGMGGNIGIQSSTIVVRGIATGKVDPQHIWRILFKQIRVGAIMGIVCGGIVGVIAYFVGEGANIGPVVAVAMFAAILVAASIGTITPMVFKRLNVDPAIAAGPFVTISNDITGLVIYFALALWLLRAV